MTSNPSAISRNAQVDHEPEQLAEDLERAADAAQFQCSNE